PFLCFVSFCVCAGASSCEVWPIDVELSSSAESRANVFMEHLPLLSASIHRSWQRSRRRRTHLEHLGHFPVVPDMLWKRLHRRLHLSRHFPHHLRMQVSHVVALVRVSLQIV